MLTTLPQLVLSAPVNKRGETKSLGSDAFTLVRRMSTDSRSPEPSSRFTNHPSLKRGKVGNAFVT